MRKKKIEKPQNKATPEEPVIGGNPKELNKPTNSLLYLLLSVIVIGSVICLFFFKPNSFTVFAWSIALILLVVSFLPIFANFRENNKDGFSFLITLFTTLIGVYLAVSISNSQEKLKTKNRNIETLLSVRTDVHESYLKKFSTYNLLMQQSQNNDSIFYKGHLEQITKPFGVFLMPRVFDFYLNQEFLLSAIHPQLISYFFYIQNMMKSLVARVNSPSCNALWKLRGEVVEFKVHLSFLEKLIDIQIDYWNGKKNDHDIKELRPVIFDEYVKKLTSLFPLAQKGKPLTHEELSSL